MTEREIALNHLRDVLESSDDKLSVDRAQLLVLLGLVTEAIRYEPRLLSGPDEFPREVFVK